MVQVTRSVLIDRPPAQAFATMGDPQQDPQWLVIQPRAGPIRLSAVRTVEPVASGSQATITGLGSSMTCTSS
jgi:uncharacterized protein YndB with AHSA1/START domain